MQERGTVVPAVIATQRRPLGVVALVAAVVVALDQVTKSVALSALADGPIDLFWTLRLDLHFNRGLAFSVASGATGWITLAALTLVFVLLLVTRRVASSATALALGLLLGGAVGNLSDRLFRDHGGAVVDFIDLQWWPVFNVADMGITIGGVLLVVGGFLEERRAASTKAQPEAASS